MKSRWVCYYALDCSSTIGRLAPKRGIDDWRGHQTRAGAAWAYPGRVGQTPRCRDEYGVAMGDWSADSVPCCAEGCPICLRRGASRSEAGKE
jgi:hypothetical protein